MPLTIITQIRKVRFEHERTSRPDPEVEFSQWVTNIMPRAVFLRCISDFLGLWLCILHVFLVFFFVFLR